MSVSMRYGSSGFAQSNGLRLDLLWTNDDPSSNFAAQTVTLDLAGYTHYMVVPIFSKSNQNTSMPVLSAVEDGAVLGLVVGSGSNNNVGSRTCYYDSTVPGIVFAGGNYGGGGNNAYCIPMFIYGIRSSGGVTVAGWSSGGGGGGVTSVNGQTGTVVLDADDVGALPDTTTYVASFNGNTGAVTYTAPVSSVNGQTGAVNLSIPSTASDVGAIAAPSSPATGAFLVWSGSAWVAQTLAQWSGGNY